MKIHGKLMGIKERLSKVQAIKKYEDIVLQEFTIRLFKTGK